MAISSSHRRQVICAVAALLAFPAVIRANVGPPASGGQLTAEPVGIKDVAIERETLSIDLRPLAERGRAKVEAVYHLYNHGAERTLDLLFASGSADVADFRVWLDDRPVASAPAANATLPESWKAPTQTPGIGGGRVLNYPLYRARPISPIAFVVTIPAGRHTLKVAYAADAGEHLDGYPTVYQQFAYVLAPARSWAGFGGLDVTVQLPAGWHAASAPELSRDGDTLTGHFSDIPADSIALTIQAPAGLAYWSAVFGSIGLLVVAAIAGIYLCWRLGRTKGRAQAQLQADGQHKGRAWPYSIRLGLSWGLAVLAAGLLATFGPDWVLPSGQSSSHYGYGQAFATIGVVMLVLVVVPIGFTIAQFTAVFVRREWARAGGHN
ncbi:MAG TPA: hypothetical protein VKD90_25240 [Gemmataceae bacterium]|nr:hypothetical protein [Gemmataceae bacterium]